MAARLHAAQVRRIAELGAAFPVGHSDGQLGAFHTRQQNRGALLDPNHGNAGLELLGLIAHESRPVFRTGNQRFELREHLAAVTHAQREAVVSVEESFKLLAGAFIE